MAQLLNLTPFAAVTLPSLSFDDRQLLVVVVASRFTMPEPTQPQTPRIAEEQPPVPLADEYRGQPGASSLRLEGQSTFMRLGTDVYLEGHAWAPAGRACEQSLVGLTIGPARRAALVFGDRIWRAGAVGAKPSAARPFTSIPLIYERCFGGSASAFNPVGCGLHARERDAIGQPLPNFEDPDAPIDSVQDRPPTAGFGPIARHWRPRSEYGGTYDDVWRRTRAPLWPKDVDVRLMNAAAPELVVHPQIAGGEHVRLVGVHPDGAIEFALPSIALQAKFEGRRGQMRQRMLIDGVRLVPDERSFTLYWRAAVAVDAGLFELDAVVVRQLHDWERAA